MVLVLYDLQNNMQGLDGFVVLLCMCRRQYSVYVLHRHRVSSLSYRCHSTPLLLVRAVVKYLELCPRYEVG